MAINTITLENLRRDFMVRYPLYKGGFIVLPEPAIKALYIIEKASKFNKSKQIKLLNAGLSFDIADSELNEVRNKLLDDNKIEFPETLAEVVALLKTSGVLVENDFNFQINYKSTVEQSPIELNNEALETVSYVRSFYHNSEKMMSYINSLDFIDLNLKQSDDAHVLLVNELIEKELEPAENAFRATFVYEVSLLKDKLRKLLTQEE